MWLRDLGAEPHQFIHRGRLAPMETREPDRHPFLDSVIAARCSGEPFGCPRPVIAFLVYLEDPGQGLHSISPLRK